MARVSRTHHTGEVGSSDASVDERGEVEREVVALTAELVAIASTNPGLTPTGAGEAVIVAHLAARLAGGGWHTRVVEPAARPPGPARPSLLAWTDPIASAPCVALCGHLDTVGVDGMTAPFDPVVDGDVLHGRGTSDMKAGVAGLVVAAEHGAATGLRAQLVLALVADEEDGSIGCEAVLAALPDLDLRPDVCLIGEPTGLASAASLRGYAVVEVTLTGRAAHSSQPEEGVNAVTHLGRLLAAVEVRHHEIAGHGESLMATVVSGGSAPFMIPSVARATIERRSTPGSGAGAALREVETILDALRSADPSVSPTARVVLERNPWELDTHGPAATFGEALSQALRVATGEVHVPVHAPYWMESALWQEAGIPALVCGPIGGGLHAIDEWVDLRQVRTYAVSLLAALRDWVGRHGD